MSADTAPDDMLGLIKALRNDPAHDFILFHFTERFFMPPEDPEEIIPLFENTGIVPKTLLKIIGETAFRKLLRTNPDDDVLLREARKHREAFHRKLLDIATFNALQLFYRTFLSFTGGRHIILVCGSGSEYARALLPFFWPADEDGVSGRRVFKEKLRVIEPVKHWPTVFKRFQSGTVIPADLLPGRSCRLEFPWGVSFSMDEVLIACENAWGCGCEVCYPAADDLNNPRALRIGSPWGGWMLAVPRPSNMSRFAKGLRSGNDPVKPHEASAPAEPVKKAVEVVRNWMTREEAAAMIRLSKDTVDNLRSEGVLVDAPKSGRQVRILKESVQRYLDGQAS